MSIRLKFYIGKNKTNLETFCAQIKATSYEDLLSYCSARNITCDVTQEEYNKLFAKKEVIKDESKQSVSPAKKPEVSKTRRRGRKPKAQKSRNADKKSDSWRFF